MGGKGAVSVKRMGRVLAVALLCTLLAGCTPAAPNRVESSSVPAGESYFPADLSESQVIDVYLDRCRWLAAEAPDWTSAEQLSPDTLVVLGYYLPLYPDNRAPDRPYYNYGAASADELSGYLFPQDEVEGVCQRYFGVPPQWVRESERYLPERESYALIYRPVPREYLFALDDWQVGGSLMSLSVSVYERTADGERGSLLRRRRISIEGTGDGGFHYVGVTTLPTQ